MLQLVAGYTLNWLDYIVITSILPDIPEWF
jgi:hypothetical protein